MAARILIWRFMTGIPCVEGQLFASHLKFQARQLLIQAKAFDKCYEDFRQFSLNDTLASMQPTLRNRLCFNRWIVEYL